MKEDKGHFWQHVFLTTLFQDSELALVLALEADASLKRVKDKMEAYHKKTGASERTYYNHRKELGLGRHRGKPDVIKSKKPKTEQHPQVFPDDSLADTHKPKSSSTPEFEQIDLDALMRDDDES